MISTMPPSGREVAHEVCRKENAERRISDFWIGERNITRFAQSNFQYRVLPQSFRDSALEASMPRREPLICIIRSSTDNPDKSKFVL